MWIEKKLEKFIEKYAEVPDVFTPYQLLDRRYNTYNYCFKWRKL